MQDFTSVIFNEPQVFIDCREMALNNFSSKKNNPIINQLNKFNKPEVIKMKVANGRIEDRAETLVFTFALTVNGALFFCLAIYRKLNQYSEEGNFKIRGPGKF